MPHWRGISLVRPRCAYTCCGPILQPLRYERISRRLIHYRHHRSASAVKTGAAHSTTSSAPDIVRIPRTDVYRFGDAPSNTGAQKGTPVFRDVEWTIREGESWAVVGPAGREKGDLFEMLLGYMRLHPAPPGGMYPFLSSSVDGRKTRDPQEAISLVSFTARRRAAGGAFVDYTARYGAVRDEDRLTLREALFSEYANAFSSKGKEEVPGDVVDGAQGELEMLAERLDLTRLLDLPMIVLSNGQTRRARVAKALLGKPELLLLDEPLTGLDVNHRPKLTNLLREIHETCRPRVLMALRPQDPLPEWITHVAAVNGSQVNAGPRSTTPFMLAAEGSGAKSRVEMKDGTNAVGRETEEGKELVFMHDVNVRYHERHILRDIGWTIREGERWHLQGSNGSGKTTLLSLITGDHPQSYTQPADSLRLFSLPRRRQPTATLARNVGIASPEIFTAFPRKMGDSALSVRDAVATGFEGTYSYRPRTPDMEERVEEIVRDLGVGAWGHGGADEQEWSNRAFSSLSSGEQSMVLLMRALVGRAPLLVLDEVFAGMDSEMIRTAKHYLREKLDPKQAVVFVTHWEEEVPWDAGRTRKLRLDGGVGVVS